MSGTRHDFLRWLLRLAGVDSPWPTTVFFIASGILIFLAGVHAWLRTRAWPSWRS